MTPCCSFANYWHLSHPLLWKDRALRNDDRATLCEHNSALFSGIRAVLRAGAGAAVRTELNIACCCYTAWARQHETHNLGKPEILTGAPSSNNLEHRLLLYRI